jgi:hypothetical protein
MSNFGGTHFGFSLIRMVLLDSFDIVPSLESATRAIQYAEGCHALGRSTRSQADPSRFQRTHFAHMPLSIAEPGGQECLDEFPSN